MDPPSIPPTNGLSQVESNSQNSGKSETAQDFIASQLSLEADAREALPYQFDTCTKPLGALRQSVYACLTCTPPPASRHQQFTPAGVCYSCSISCHSQHNLVELFTKRDFECDCGSTRMSNSGTPCNLRHNADTGRKGGVTGEKAREGNKYNHNFQGQFCACGDEYDPEKEKGTMFQCLGLGTVEDGGCGEDWWHPECLMGLPRIQTEVQPDTATNGALKTVKEETENEDGEAAAQDEGGGENHEANDPTIPPGFPDEDDFDHLICYKCVNAFPWIRQYAGTPGFLIAGNEDVQTNEHNRNVTNGDSSESSDSKKRKAEDEPEDLPAQDNIKKARSESSTADAPVEPSTTNDSIPAPKHTTLPSPPSNPYITLFLQESFRDEFCRCALCFSQLAKHKQLIEEEEAYEPPLSESSHHEDDRRSINSGSLYERGEAALSSIDRVRAIEGVMAYNHVKDKVKEFLRPYAESGEVVGAEDIKAYFAKLRGDGLVGKENAGGVGEEGGGGEKDFRREQGGY